MPRPAPVAADSGATILPLRQAGGGHEMPRLQHSARADLMADLLARQVFLARVNVALGAAAAATLIGPLGVIPPLAWLAALALAQFGRLQLWRRWRTRPLGSHNLGQLGAGLTLTSLVSGVIWGLLTVVCMGNQHARDAFLPFVLAGMTAGAITTLSSYLPAFIAYVVPTVAPYVVLLSTSSDPFSREMAVIGAVYMVLICITALQLNRALRSGAKLHLRNTRLVAGLERSRQDLEQRVELRTAELRTANEALLGEVSQRRRSEQRVRHLLAHDTLTNLPNRLLLVDRLQQAIARTRRYGGLVAVLAFDVDRFKEINDTFGHPTGDAVLRELAARIRVIVRSTDTPARIGGDEFALVAPDLADTGGAIRIAEKLLAACEPPIDAGGIRVEIGVSIGIALFPEHGDELDDLLTGADLALYAAKAAGRGKWLLFSAEMRAAAHARRRLESQLRDAVPGDQLRLVYQPRYALDDGRIVAAEALLRWQHPELGLLSPGDFIDVAETSGSIREIGRWVLGAACEQARCWRDAGSPVRVAVNLSAVEFRQPDLPDQIRAVLDRTGIDPSLLELEITESVYMDQRAAGLEDELRRVKDLGVLLAIDDFGTGYSSLAYLRWVPFDILKIDRSFVTNLPDDQRDEAIVKTIVTLAQQLDKTVVAEGVEKRHQLDTLRRLGCHEAQGYLLSRPLPPEMIGRLLVA